MQKTEISVFSLYFSSNFFVKKKPCEQSGLKRYWGKKTRYVIYVYQKTLFHCRTITFQHFLHFDSPLFLAITSFALWLQFFCNVARVRLIKAPKSKFLYFLTILYNIHRTSFHGQNLVSLNFGNFDTF